MKLIDLHCDTALALWEQKASLKHNDFNISLEKSNFLDKYIQLTAIFTPPNLTDNEGWEQFLLVRENLLRECRENDIALIKTADELVEFEKSAKKTAFILTIEDARILDGKIERVRKLFELGVRVATPLWGGKTSIGGSHDTDMRLTDFGKEAVREMLNVGIIPDISHASFSSAHEILELCSEAKKSPIATHMNSYHICAHSRNIRDDQLDTLVKLGGIIGVSFCPEHLTKNTPCTSDNIIEHFLYYSRYGAKASFGSDYDGTDLPDDMHDITDVTMIMNKLAENGVSNSEMDNISWNTAYDFLKNNLPQ